MTIQEIEKLLGEEGQALLKHECKTISKDLLHLPGPDFVDRVWIGSDRPAAVLRNLQLLFNTGRLAGTGYVSILPVDQGIELVIPEKRPPTNDRGRITLIDGNGTCGRKTFSARKKTRGSDCRHQIIRP